MTPFVVSQTLRSGSSALPKLRSAATAAAKRTTSVARCFSNGPKKLADNEVAASVRLLTYQGTPFPWVAANDNKSITKTFMFTDFNQAWSFMSRSALMAEKMDHHPEWMNVYNRVEVTLTTHDCDGVSQKDIDMARAMETFASDLMPDGSKSYLSPVPPTEKDRNITRTITLRRNPLQEQHRREEQSACTRA